MEITITGEVKFEWCWHGVALHWPEVIQQLGYEWGIQSAAMEDVSNG